MASSAATAAAQAPSAGNPTTEAAGDVGSVIIEASNGLGGTNRIYIQDITSTANLGIPLDLKRIAFKCRNTEFNPRRHGAVVMKLREPPGVTCLLFASGKVCLKGCNTITQASMAAQRLSKILQHIGYTPKEYLDFKVTNIVASADVGFPIRLEALGYAHSMFASFEPEIFPGVIYRLVHPRVVFMVFSSGKLVMTAAKMEADLSVAFAKMYPILMDFKKDPVPMTPKNTSASEEGTDA